MLPTIWHCCHWELVSYGDSHVYQQQNQNPHWNYVLRWFLSMLNSGMLCVVIQYSTWSSSIQPKVPATQSSSVPRVLSIQIQTKHVFSQGSSYSSETKQLQMFSCGEQRFIFSVLWVRKSRPGLRNFTCLVQADVWSVLVPLMLHLQKKWMNAMTSQSGLRGHHTSSIRPFFYKHGIHSWLGYLLQSKHVTTGGIHFNVTSGEEIIQSITRVT